MGERHWLEMDAEQLKALERDGRREKPLSHSEAVALEMALHEDAERQALAGQLALLTAAWREAEEIAAIADSLFLPAAASPPR